MLNFEYPPLGGGAAPVTKHLCEHLIAKHHEVTVITSHFKGLKKYEKHNNLIIHRVPALRRKKEQSNAFELAIYTFFASLKSVQIQNIDIIHAHFIIPTGILAVMLRFTRNVPMVITAHGSDVPGYNPDRFQLMHMVTLPLWKLIVNAADRITTPSLRLKRLITKQDHVPVQVVHNGINFQQLKKPKKQKIILYAGRLFARKKVDDLLWAAKNCDWTIAIAGDGPEKENLQSLAKELGVNATFLGWLSAKQLKEWYAKSSIFVLPSIEESFGMVILEAMQYHCAVIGRKTCEEVIGDAGHIFDSKEELTSLLDKLTSNSKELDAYQKKAYHRSAQFDWNTITNEFLEIYAALQKE